VTATIVEVSAADVDLARQLPARRLPHRVINRDDASRRHWVILGMMGGVLGVVLWLDARLTLAIAMALVIVAYTAALAYRLWLLTFTINEGGQIQVPDAVARALRDNDLPVYTLLIPAYGEPRVIGKLLAAIDALEYPKAKLDVKLLLEADDHPTIRAVLSEDLADCHAPSPRRSMSDCFALAANW
jgi:hypothetical protein